MLLYIRANHLCPCYIICLWNDMNCLFQTPDIRTGNDRVDAVVVDEESLGSVNSPGCGGKILRGDGALERYLAMAKLKENVVWNHSTPLFFFPY